MLRVTVGLLVLLMLLLISRRLSGVSCVLGDSVSSDIVCSGCWLSDPLNNLFGRRGAIFITALILVATPIASGFSHSWQTLFVIRLILGIGMGVKGGHCHNFRTVQRLNYRRLHCAHLCRRKFPGPD